MEDLDTQGKVDEVKLHHWSSAEVLGLLRAVNLNLVSNSPVY